MSKRKQLVWEEGFSLLSDVKMVKENMEGRLAAAPPIVAPLVQSRPFPLLPHSMQLQQEQQQQDLHNGRQGARQQESHITYLL